MEVKVRVSAPDTKPRITEVPPTLPWRRDREDETSSGFETLMTGDSDVMSQVIKDLCFQTFHLQLFHMIGVFSLCFFHFRRFFRHIVLSAKNILWFLF